MGGDNRILVNPEDDYYSSFFTRKWNREMTMKIFPPRRGLTDKTARSRLVTTLFGKNSGRKSTNARLRSRSTNTSEREK